MHTRLVLLPTNFVLTEPDPLQAQPARRSEAARGLAIPAAMTAMGCHTMEGMADDLEQVSDAIRDAFD